LPLPEMLPLNTRRNAFGPKTERSYSVWPFAVRLQRSESSVSGATEKDDDDE
jgi:hypothetical protein